MFKTVYNLVTTEKSSLLQEKNIFVLNVNLSVNKIELKKYIESTFDVTVEEVRTVIIKGKKRKQKKYVGFTRTVKKAYVKLKKGDIITQIENKEKKNANKKI
ncbi:MAG: 50S ribosomal protein L23 [bacterium]